MTPPHTGFGYSDSTQDVYSVRANGSPMATASPMVPSTMGLAMAKSMSTTPTMSPLPTWSFTSARMNKRFVAFLTHMAPSSLPHNGFRDIGDKSLVARKQNYLTRTTGVFPTPPHPTYRNDFAHHSLSTQE